ncbi:GGDEF domain-containing protein [Chromobacterium vaccinii]|uniref:GGDEF domain-containing protein n=1 Tax=Chromobacterium vaccinii TaxID=1108595 RepID=UPI001E56B2B1|nr:GGDEF domain-containing protein [Chromobacterium vaccinii]MCD4485861.1 GGDEF domain-containing protein [Chromobacterium vaccinii]MCD4499941.1 GGDEF domain-containing protein [Chromobacterium vaccinii]
MRLSKIFTIVTFVLFILACLPLAWIINGEWAAYHAADEGLGSIQIAHLAMVAVEKISTERGPANALIGAPADGGGREKLRVARLASDRALQDLVTALSPSRSAYHRQALAAIRVARQRLSEARHDMDRIIAAPAPAATEIMAPIRRMFDVVPVVLEAVNALSFQASSVYPQLSNPLSGARLATELREYAGRLGSTLVPALTEKRPLTETEAREVFILRGRIEQLRGTIRLRLSVPTTQQVQRQALSNMENRYFRNGLARVDDILLASRLRQPYAATPAAFTAAYMPTLHSIVELRDSMLSTAADEAAIQQRAAFRHLLAATALGVIALIAQLALFAYIRWLIAKPLLAASKLLSDIADGRLDAELPATLRKDEIGDVLRAIAILRRNSQEKRVLEQERQRLIDELTEVSRIDFLTGIANRRAFTQTADAEIARACRAGESATLILFDIDHFKQVNDQHGHDSGDAVLVHVAAIIERICRENDLAGRYGGEEFVVLASHGNASSGETLAERLRAGIAESPCSLPSGQQLAVTASFGVATLGEASATLESLLQAADRALYAAKRQGRNRVVAA